MGLTESRAYNYPPARKDDVVDDYHGTPVADPYRWLEDPQSADTKAWITAQNELTRQFIDAIPARAMIHQRLTQLWDYPKFSAPEHRGGRYFFYKNDGLQNQAILYKQDTLQGEATVLLDPNWLSPDGTAAITSQAFSEDGRYLAYGVSHSGSDQQEIFIRDVDSGQDYPESLKYCRFAGIAWKHNGSGFFYNRNPKPGTVPDADLYKHNKVYWHTLNTPQAEDVLIYERPDAPELSFYPQLSDDGRYLILQVTHAAVAKNRLYYREVESNEPFVRLIDQPIAYYYYVGNDGPTFFVQTDLAAPNGRLVAIELAQPQPDQWRTLIPEQEDTMVSAQIINHQFVVSALHNAHHRIRFYQLNGTASGELELPALGAVDEIHGQPEDQQFFFGFQSYLFPHTPFRFDLQTQELIPLHESLVAFDTDPYETVQLFYESKDGTRVPMFLTHKKGLILDGQNPTLLYGYGGFNISYTPAFSVAILDWLENDGVYAVANLRGGNEYGEAWHEAGMLDKKQNVFDDFIGAAEWLIANGYTNSSRLGIMGRSNGGLLVAACLLQRPELFGAVICAVPVTDMLRFHLFTAGRYWTAEYGNAENPEHFPFMVAYSPLHNVKLGATYPPTLITTAETDDRVVPMHAQKFAATLQAADSGANPILIRIETGAGHGMGKPTSKVIDEFSDVFAFLQATLCRPA
jgi:prolyl oligopeptidase